MIGAASRETGLAGTPYAGYLYGYPHKTAYRPLDPPVSLASAWKAEPRDALFLYLHVPFCEMRCGFCNLFTTTRPVEDAVARYLLALERQATRVRALLPDARFARLAIGGGTPTFLDGKDLDRLFDVAARVGCGRVPTSVECSPGTVDAERVARLRERGATRVSIGVQSFLPSELAAAGRPESADPARALDLLREGDFATLNLDLIYGIDGQTPASWLSSLRTALTWRPEELYLYPLYVRPLTGLDRRARAADWDAQRLSQYRIGRDFLVGEGYEQGSMRRFFLRGSGSASVAALDAAPEYSCQQDGMVGLGCGARSYTSALHYSNEYAVGAKGVRGIIDAYVATADADFDMARYGMVLDGEEQRRRFVALSLLGGGLERGAYRQRFSSEVAADLPQLGELERLGLARLVDDTLALTPEGVERADAIGPWLASPRVQALMAATVLR